MVSIADNSPTNSSSLKTARPIFLIPLVAFKTSSSEEDEEELEEPESPEELPLELADSSELSLLLEDEIVSPQNSNRFTSSAG